MYKKLILIIILVLPFIGLAEVYLGNYNTPATDINSVNNPRGKYGSTHYFDSIHNKYSKYGSKYSEYSVNNPYALHAPKLYDQRGNYRGRLSINKYDPESINNPYGKYGSRYSPDSINNPYGPGRTLAFDVIEIWGE